MEEYINSENKTVAFNILNYIKSQGVDTIFGIPGGEVLHFVDAMEELKINFIVTRHEQAAVHAADGYSRTTGKIGVCLGTAGPGASNMITGIATADRDGSSILAIVGNVARQRSGTDAFQEFSAIDAVKMITGFCARISEQHEWFKIIDDAFSTLKKMTPRAGLIEIPADIAGTKCVNKERILIKENCGFFNLPIINDSDIKKTIELLRLAKRPVILAGGGCCDKSTRNLVKRFSERYCIPVVSTINSLSNSWETKLWLGLCGGWGLERANQAIWETDFVLALGTRFVHHVGNVFDCSEDKKKSLNAVQVDCSMDRLKKSENSNPKNKLQIHAEINQFIEDLDNLLKEINMKWDDWSNYIYNKSLKSKSVFYDRSIAVSALQILGQTMQRNSIVFSDIGQHLLWSARYLFKPGPGPEQFFTSSGYGTMGFGLPASLGSLIGLDSTKPTWLITGDGSLMMSIAELDTLAKLELPLKIIIFDNNSLGLVYQVQNMFFNSNIGTTSKKNTPFIKIAEAFGIKSRSVQDISKLHEAIQWLVNTETAAILHIVVPTEDKVLPMFGSSKENSIFK